MIEPGQIEIAGTAESHRYLDLCGPSLHEGALIALIAIKYLKDGRFIVDEGKAFGALLHQNNRLSKGSGMELPVNHFKRSLAAGKQQIGIWCTLSHAYAAEAVAGAGVDWLLIDTEHSPGEVETVLSQLQAVAPYSCSAVVRPASNDAVLIKKYLDIGAQSLLIPYVQTVREAEYAVEATRYAPAGFRGVSALTRATRFGRIPDYATRAHTEICVLVQVETQAGLDNLEGIAATEGVDGVFIGPGDLAASLGFVGQPGHPKVVAAIEDAIQRIIASGKPAGILTGDAKFAQQCIAWGTLFTAVGVDIGLLARGADALKHQFKA